MRRLQLFQDSHKRGLLFLANEDFFGTSAGIRVIVVARVNWNFLWTFLAPALDAFLMGDSKKPGAEFVILPKAADVPRRVNERLLDNIEAGLFIVKKFKYISVERQLVAFEQSVPSVGVADPGFRHGQLFAFRHYRIYTQ